MTAQSSFLANGLVFGGKVKSIHESDDENDYLTGRGKYAQQKDARKVEHSLGSALRTKLDKTIRKAAEQLRNYQGKKADKRILRLYVQLDSRCAHSQTVEELKEFLAEKEKEGGIEIEHEIKTLLIDVEDAQ